MRESELERLKTVITNMDKCCIQREVLITIINHLIIKEREE